MCKIENAAALIFVLLSMGAAVLVGACSTGGQQAIQVEQQGQSELCLSDAVADLLLADVEFSEFAGRITAGEFEGAAGFYRRQGALPQVQMLAGRYLVAIDKGYADIDNCPDSFTDGGVQFRKALSEWQEKADTLTKWIVAVEDTQ